MESLISLHSGGVGILISASSDLMPSVLHWGQDMGPITADEAATLQRTSTWPPVSSTFDGSLQLGIIPEERWGWKGRPGLVGHRGGKDWSPTWHVTQVLLDGSPVDGFVAGEAGVIEYQAEAPAAGLAMTIWVEMLPMGLVRARASLTNLADDAFQLDELTIRFPVPSQARELMDFAGRWAVERVLQRQAFSVGAYRRENRHGRTGADSSYILSAGERGFGYQQGEIWATHVGWSGNHIQLAERDQLGAQVIGGGELLLAGEGRLAQGESYESPWVYFNYAHGLDAQAGRFHEFLRSLPVHPATDRPVTLNVWEAVYFDHDLERLTDLAQRAAELGVERYVLDDGWFGARRNDFAGLGDWVVSADVWPDGLHPLINEVKRLGMQFGLWFEPEMVNEDSDVARAHPQWIMQLPDRMPVEARHQQVLNLGIPEAYDHVFQQMTALFEEYAIDYVKWDHNRDLIDAGTMPDGQAGVAAQTRAFYRLLDELRSRFPSIEFESCSSGGARIDLGVMERAERVWVSDNIDPQDRQRMLWWTGQLLPPELMGNHVASGRSHVTGRWHDLNFRAATAVFGHFGIEWDLAQATEDELQQLSWWINWYKEHRTTLHTGRVVRLDIPDEGVYCKGVVSPDQAIFSIAQLEGTTCGTIGHLKLPGLEPEAHYRINVVDPQPSVEAIAQTPWINSPGDVVLTGEQLAAVGIQAPIMRPCTAVLLVLDRVR